MIVSNALVKVGHCQVNYNHPPRTKKLDGGFAFAQCKSTGLLNSAFDQSLLNKRVMEFTRKVNVSDYDRYSKVE
jgi:hypothetical protein